MQPQQQTVFVKHPYTHFCPCDLVDPGNCKVSYVCLNVLPACVPCSTLQVAEEILVEMGQYFQVREPLELTKCPWVWPHALLPVINSAAVHYGRMLHRRQVRVRPCRLLSQQPSPPMLNLAPASL